MTCLYAVHRELGSDLPADELLERVIAHLAVAMQFPDLAAPSIELDGRRVAHAAYREGLTHRISASIGGTDGDPGRLSVAYLDDRPFLPEEQDLLDAVADGIRVWRERGRDRSEREQGIAERKAAEEREERLVDRLWSTLEHMSDAFYMVDREWRFVYLNAQAEKLLRRGRDSLLGRNIWDEYPDVVGTEIESVYRRAMEEGLPATVDFYYYPPLDVWFDVSAHPGPEGLAVYFRDASDRYRVSEAMRASEERFRILSRVTNDAIWDWNLETDELWWSDGFEHQFGLEADDRELNGAAWKRRIHPEDVDAVVDGIHRVIDGAASEWGGEYRFRRSDGTYAMVVDRGHVIRDATGRGIRMIGGMRDVSEQRALEDQLRQSQRLESVGQLTGGVAHDFNNLLTVIMGNTELLTEELAGDPERRELAEMALGAARRGAELTQRLLAFARRQPLEPRAVDINALLEGMRGLLRRTLGANIEVDLHLGPDVGPALVDAGQLESAVLNLALNARDAMPDGGKLTIETDDAVIDTPYAAYHVDVEPGRYVMVAVSDTGSGIAPEHLDRVFDPFFTTKRAGRGTGLGLSMVYGFVKQSGGHVRLYSEPGHGTTARMYLPPAGVADPAEVADPVGEPVGGSERILLVEDNELVRQYVEGQLRGLGYEVVTAATGPAALEALDRHHPIDLLFTDVIMPGGMNGRELADAARVKRPGLRVLFTSGYADSAIIHHGRLDAGVHLLTKPYRRTDLARALRTVLDEGDDAAGMKA